MPGKLSGQLRNDKLPFVDGSFFDSCRVPVDVGFFYNLLTQIVKLPEAPQDAAHVLLFEQGREVVLKTFDVLFGEGVAFAGIIPKVA